MYMPTYEVVHNWRGQVNKSGRYKIHIRATVNRRSIYPEVKIPMKVSKREDLIPVKARLRSVHV